MSKRIRWFGIAMIVMFGALLLQLDNIQGLKASQYQNSAKNPTVIENEFSKPRGRIVSSDGAILAESVQAPSSDIYSFLRQYPTGSLFAQIVGFTSYNYEPASGPTTGVEAEYNDLLKYHTQPITDLGEIFNTEAGTDQVILTVSDKLQTLAREALGSKVGAVVALNPSNGDILAMYSNPSFDPNLLASPSAATEAAGWRSYIAVNPVTGAEAGTPIAYNDRFAPGSTFKVITTAAAFDHDKPLTTMSYPFRSGYTPPATNIVLHNDNGGTCGGTIQLMLPQSCDTGYAMMGVDLGAQNLSTEANAFGFNTRPPIDLPTSPGSVSYFPSALNLEEKGLPFVAYSAIGQYKVQATPLEMAMVASAIADYGVIMTPHVMYQVLDPKDNVVESYKPAQWIRATSAQTAQSVSSLMQAVVENPRGTAYGIFPSSWDVAAKTGTAQAGTGNNSTDDWMIAFAPASAPKIAIAVLVPHQAVSATGASVAGPIVRSVLSGVFPGSS